MLDSKAQTRLVVGLILLILTGPFVLSRGLLAYPVAALWHRRDASRRGPTS